MIFFVSLPFTSKKLNMFGERTSPNQPAKCPFPLLILQFMENNKKKSNTFENSILRIQITKKNTQNVLHIFC